MRPLGEYIALSIPSNPRYLGLLRTVVGSAADLLGFAEDEKHGMMLAVNEGCTNIIQHCYCMDDSKTIDVTIRIFANRLEVELRDYGEYRELADPPHQPPGELRPGGLGLKLITETMDEVEYRPAGRDGTLLTMVKYLTTTRDG